MRRLAQPQARRSLNLVYYIIQTTPQIRHSAETPKLATVGRLRPRLGATTKCKDVEKQSMLSKIYRACKEWQGWEGKGDFVTRMDFTRRMLFFTIENVWNLRLGPNPTGCAAMRNWISIPLRVMRRFEQK